MQEVCIKHNLQTIHVLKVLRKILGCKKADINEEECCYVMRNFIVHKVTCLNELGNLMAISVLIFSFQCLLGLYSLSYRFIIPCCLSLACLHGVTTFFKCCIVHFSLVHIFHYKASTLKLTLSVFIKMVCYTKNLCMT